MSVCIAAEAIGADMCVAFDDESVRWVDEPPPNALLYTGSLKARGCLDTVLKLAASSAALSVPENYAALAKQALRGANPVMWSHVMPKRVFKRFLMDFIDAVRRDSVEVVRPYYESTWEHVGSFLSTLQPMMLAGQSVGRVTYDRLATRTGRMVVSDGPRVLTMPREARSKICGALGAPVMYVDFRALEPSLVANAVGLRYDGSDLYAWLAEHVIRASSRDAAKRAVVCALYGSAEARTADAAKIAATLCTSDLSAQIRASALDGDRVTSLYGRVVKSERFNDDGCVINDRFQSTAVDAACEGFAVVCAETGAVPLAVIHDAVIVEDVMRSMTDGQVGSVELPTVGKLYFKITRLS